MSPAQQIPGGRVWGVKTLNGDINPIELKRVIQLLEDGKENVWYNSSLWKRRRAKVMRMDNYECQICKKKGRHQKAVLVHHVKHLKDRPDLALSIYDPDTGERQLISVCKKCHEELHPEARRKCKTHSAPITDEWWD